MSSKVFMHCCVAAFLASGASAWSLSPCPDESELLQRTKDAILSAEEGSALFVLHPFPQTEQEVLENFRHRFLDVWGDPTTRPVREEERRMIQLLRSGRARFSVARVDNWKRKRCHPYGPSFYYHLVSVRDATGVEVGRSLMNQQGRLVRGVPLEWDQTVDPLLELERASDGLRAKGLIGQDVQYVALDSMGGLTCDALWPCAALRGNGEIFLVDSEMQIFRLREADERFSFLAMEQEPTL